nr:ATP synthase F0 subunit 6 [Acanalonia sp.]
MMTSLFSSFDPSSSIMQMNWILILTTTVLLPMNFWIKKSPWNMLKKTIEKKLIEEMKNISHHKEMMIFSTSTFIMILVMNTMGLFPYTFTPSSHLCLTLSIALPMWMSMMIYGWVKHTNKMFTHLLPSGTPTPIMPMMIIIETLGNMIRPISLSVRLMANMMAGHLLMTLLGNNNSLSLEMMILPTQIMLTMFESAISVIQAYVFSTLLTLYSSETP